MVIYIAYYVGVCIVGYGHFSDLHGIQICVDLE